jgi:hypothetical protein
VSEYVIWKYTKVPFASVLEPLQGMDDSFKLLQGVPLQEGFPDGVEFHMDPDFPNNLALPDNIRNLDLVILGGARLAASLQARKLEKVEYLPVSIIDHKDRPAGPGYMIVHPIDPVDCVDTSQSVFKLSPIDESNFDSFSKLVLDTKRIPKERSCFRLKGFWDIVVVRKDLAESLDKEAFSGLGWLPIQDYPEK